MDTTVYDMRSNLEGERARLEKADISKSVKDAITEFLDSVKIEDVSSHRIFFYGVRLRLTAEMMKDSFLHPDLKTVQKFVANLKTTTSRRGSEYSQNTINDFRIALKRFYKWKGLLTPEIAEILKKREIKANKRSEDIITQVEVRSLISHAVSPRDKFLIALAYDSGCRISELLTMRIKDVVSDEYGLILHVTGKTGERKVRCVGDSVALFNDWIARHPLRDNTSAWLFIKIDSGKYKFNGEAMDYDTAVKVLHNASARAGINRRIHWHLFRHTRATLLARDVKEAPLEAQMGWVHGSKQTQTYVHLSDQDVDNSILKAYGIEVKDNKKMHIDELPRVCERCGTVNTSDAVYCKKCALPLNRAKLQEITEKEEKTLNILENLDLNESEKALLDAIKDDKELMDKLLLRILRSLKERDNSSR
jgi:integrase/ribosomal protein L40E